MKKMKKSQRTEVLRYMLSHNFITSEEAHDMFGVNRMGSVIADLRERGILIDTVMVDGTNRYGNPSRYGRYFFRGTEGTGKELVRCLSME